MNKKVVIGIAMVASAGAGFLGGYLVGKNQVVKQINASMEDAWNKARNNEIEKERIAEKFNAKPAEERSDYIPTEEDLNEANRIAYEKYGTKNRSVDEMTLAEIAAVDEVREEIREIIEKSDELEAEEEEDDEDDLVSVDIFSEHPSEGGYDEDPYPISEDEFFNGPNMFDRVDLQYYVKDHTLTNDNDEIIPDGEGCDLLGSDNMDVLANLEDGYYYVRNESIGTDYSIMILNRHFI